MIIKPVPFFEDHERFLSRIAILDNGCWNYTFSKCQGYGVFYIRSNGKTKSYRAHRVSWEIFKGKIPEGMVLDHICRNKGCVNPSHLRVVSCKINTIENSDGPAAINAKKNACPRGHLFAGENLYISPVGARMCKKCMAESRARFKKSNPVKTSNISNKNKTHCHRGHEFNEKNTRVTIRDGSPERSCKACCIIRRAKRRGIN